MKTSNGTDPEQSHFRLLPLDDITRPMWATFVATQPGANIFHTLQWIDAMQEAYGGRAYLAVRCNLKTVVAGFSLVLVKSKAFGEAFVSLPFSDHCAPLVNESDIPDAVRSVGAERPLQVRWTLSGVGGASRMDVGFLHTTPLKELRAIRSAFDKTRVLQPLRKAERNPSLVVDHRRDRDALRAFQQLSLDAHRRLKALHPPSAYYDALFEHVLQNADSFVLLVRYRGKIVAGAVFLIHQQTITYKHGASLPEFWFLAPNHLLLWRAMMAGANCGCTRFDWGRTNKAHDSLRRFKAAWATEEVPLSYANVNFRQPVWPWMIRRILCYTETLLPRPYTRLLGALFSRHFW